MNFIELDEILSTTLLHDGFCNYSGFLKLSKSSIDALLNTAYDNEEKLSGKEFLYKFTNTFTINRIKLPVTKGDIMSYEIFNVIDSLNDKENIITKAKNTFIEKDHLEINLENIELDNIKIRITSKKNIYPGINEILIGKSNC
ncbi:hypothetical protein [Clostridium tertium]|uniref:Uncharacterized protein n=1 Tax=Clostridium tertium TaxID=1559 RepID=A0A6N3FEQ3_9CLOT